jgi:hypothetical protein
MVRHSPSSSNRKLDMDLTLSPLDLPLLIGGIVP